MHGEGHGVSNCGEQEGAGFTKYVVCGRDRLMRSCQCTAMEIRTEGVNGA